MTLLTQGVSGRLGGLQYAQGPVGTIWKSMPPPRLRFTPGERAQQDRVRRIGAAWRTLGLEEIGLWREFAEGAVAMLPAMRRPPAAPYNAFLALGTRVLQVDPRAALPRTPPASPFGGDAVTVVGEASSSFDCERRGQGGESLSAFEVPLSTPQPPPLTGVKGGGAGLLFRADRPNSPGVVTELMAQRLLSVGRAPRPKGYASQGFVAFAEGALDAEVACPPGWYALAVRFVRAGTGQDTAVFPLGIVGVGGA